MKRTLQLSTALTACGIFAGSANAAIVFTLGGSDPTPSGVEVTVTNLTNGSPTDTNDPASPAGYDDDTGEDSFVASGTLSDVSNTDSISFIVNGYNTSSVSSSNLTLSGLSDFTKSDTKGWGVSGGFGNNLTDDDALTFTFDLSDLPAGSFLRISDVTGAEDFNNGTNELQVIVDGKSTTTFSGLSATGLSIDVGDGDLLAFRQLGLNGEARIQSFTFEVVPEPGSLALMGLGGLCLLRRRRS